MKICLECAEGGHLEEILSLSDSYKNFDYFFITTKAPTTEFLVRKNQVYYLRDQFNNSGQFAIYLREFVLLFFLIPKIFWILVKEKPKVIISTGGGCTIPLCYMGKCIGIKIIYIESLARINSPSGTGRFVYPIADLFLVQWSSMLKIFKNAKYWGNTL